MFSKNKNKSNDDMASKAAKHSEPAKPAPAPAPAATTNPKFLNGGVNGDSLHIDDRPMTPTRLSRLDEKNALVGLNNRLAAIIDRNQHLETENAKLSAQVQTAEQSLTKSTSTLKTTFEKENSDIRRKLDAAEKYAAKLGLSETNLKAQLNDANAKLQKKDKENGDLAKQLQDSDAKGRNTENELKKQKDESNKLAKQKQDLDDELKKALAELAKLRKSNEDGVLAKVELENALRNKGEELQLKSTIHEQEVSVIRSTNQNQLKEIGGKLQQEYDTKLEEAIRSLRDDCNQTIRANKKDQEALFTMKEKDLRGQVEKLSGTLASKGDELSGIMLKVEAYNTQISNLDGEKHSLTQKLKGAEEKIKFTTERLTKELADLDKLIKQLQDEKKTLINEYQDLMEVKVALDNEIAVYRKLLEGEEKRLFISADAKKEKKLAELEQQVITAL